MPRLIRKLKVKLAGLAKKERVLGALVEMSSGTYYVAEIAGNIASLERVAPAPEKGESRAPAHR